MKMSGRISQALLLTLGLAVAGAYGCSGDQEAEEPVAADAAKEEPVADAPEEAEPAAEPAEAAPAPEAAAPAPAAEPEGFNGAKVSRYVTSYALNVRTGPGKEFPVKRHVKWGDKIDVVINGEWAKLGTGEYVSINRLAEKAPTKGRRKGK